MFRFSALATIALAAGLLVAAPDAPKPDAKALAEQLSAPEAAVRQAAREALKDRADALPWVRRAQRTGAPVAAGFLLEPFEKARQKEVAKAIDACIRDGHIDLVMEFHHYWQPANKDDLWPVGARAAKLGFELYAKSCPKAEWEVLKEALAAVEKYETMYHDGPCPEKFEDFKGAWSIRTNRLDSHAHLPTQISLASVDGPVRSWGRSTFVLALGPVRASALNRAFVACTEGVNWDVPNRAEPSTNWSVVVCRGAFVGRSNVFASVILVDGDIDLTGVRDLKDSLIRATGNIQLPKNVKPVNCTIAANAKDATAPYKFFAPADVGVTVASAKGGVTVTAVAPKTPFGESGLKVGDLIRAIDDAPAKNADEFRTKLRRAVVRQGDCLVTIERDGKALDLPVFFLLPK
jgi:hypothetical protein